MLPALYMAVGIAAASFVAYVLWPTWPTGPGASAAPAAPAIPITVAGVLFNVPPTAIRAAVQRHPGPQERIDLAFQWPSLAPPPPGDDQHAEKAGTGAQGDAASPHNRLFVTIASAGAALPPAERLRSIYPRYAEARPAAGPDGLAILPFRTGTPYTGEDLVYLAANPDRFFARCSREAGSIPGTCIREISLATAAMTLRFPRTWLEDWRSVAAGFDRLVSQLQSDVVAPTTQDR